MSSQDRLFLHDPLHWPPQPSESPHAASLAHLGAQTHCPLSLHVGLSIGQVPHIPPQPSDPHILFPQAGTHMHWPASVHISLDLHMPQTPPQLSGPHILPMQAGGHMHWPAPVHVGLSIGQVPQLPPQPSGPQDLPVQAGTQTHTPASEHISLDLQLPQLPPQPSPPHFFVPQLGAQTHVPDGLHTWPAGQPPQHWVLGMQAPLHIFSFGQHWPARMHAPFPHDLGWLAGQPQERLLQASTPAHWWPQLPQLPRSLTMSWQWPPHHNCPEGQQSFRLATQVLGLFGQLCRPPGQPQLLPLHT